MNDAAIRTRRLRLRTWSATDQEDFFRLHDDPEVMKDYGGPISRIESNAKLERYMESHRKLGFSRWAIETSSGEFIGYAGVMPSPNDHPTAPALQIGWRLVRSAWGHGFASEAARAALNDVFARGMASEVIAFTAADNLRSQALMGRLALRRDPARDFKTVYDGVEWSGLVWVADGTPRVRPST